MSTRYLNYFFQPQSVAVFGASEKPMSMGGIVLRNLLDAGFKGQLMAVNLKPYHNVYGVRCYSSARSLPKVPELAILCTPPQTIPKIVKELGVHGVKAVLVLTGGISRAQSKNNKILEEFQHFFNELLGFELGQKPPRLLKDLIQGVANRYDMRLMGPNCIGVLSAQHQLNASYAHSNILAGHIAFIGQSGILSTAMIDWANGRGVGFSHFTSLGDSVEVEFADLIDYLVEDPNVKVILLHIETIQSARRFISAVRMAARKKLVVALKSGRFPASQEYVEPIPLGLSNGDVVYRAMFRRAGALRLESTDELLDALSVLTRMKPLHGQRLAIISNGVGPNLLAADALLRHGGELAKLSKATLEALAPLLPPFWSKRHPIDLNADAGPERYAQVLYHVAQDEGVDAILLNYGPSVQSDAEAVANAVIDMCQQVPCNVLTCWLGMNKVETARQQFDAAGIPNFITPEEAIYAFMQMVAHRQTQEALLQTPPLFLNENVRHRKQVWSIVNEALHRDREWLTPEEAAQVLAAYDIQLAPSVQANTLEALLPQLENLSPPYIMRAVHPVVCYPFQQKISEDACQQQLNHATADNIAQVADILQMELARWRSESPILGYSVQSLYQGQHSLKLRIGISRHNKLGAFILFSAGGSASQHFAEPVVELLPINLKLARDLICSSKVVALFSEYSQHPEHDIQRLCEMLVSLSQIVVDVPVINTLDINPILLNRKGILPLHVKIGLGETAELAIQPYPEELQSQVTLQDGEEIALRPIRGEDEPAHLRFLDHLSPESIRYRFFQNKHNISHLELARLTQIDYSREMAFIAVAQREKGMETVGVVRAYTDPDNIQAEFALIVSDHEKRRGLGAVLTRKMIDYCQKRGTLQMIGTVLPDNEAMLQLVRHLGFSVNYAREEEVMKITLLLNTPSSSWQQERLW